MALSRGRGSRSIRAAMFGIVILLTVAEPCAAQQTVSAPGGVAVGGNNSGPVYIGISQEALPGIIEAATKDSRNLSSQQKQTIDDLQDKLGVNENALKAFFAVLD